MLHSGVGIETINRAANDNAAYHTTGANRRESGPVREARSAASPVAALRELARRNGLRGPRHAGWRFVGETASWRENR